MNSPVIDEQLARALIDSQFPRWSHLAVVPVQVSGIDNRTFRLGEELSIRLPSGDWYAQQVDKEQRWLPVLAPQLPLVIPTPEGRGVPGHGYPYAWSVYRWLPGETVTPQRISDLTGFAITLADFLVALRAVDATDGPQPGPHNYYRGGPLSTYAQETYDSIDALGEEVSRDAVLSVWDDAMATDWQGDPVWFHGDVSIGNLLVQDGLLSAVIDFGSSGVGDPACDIAIAWTFLTGESRDAFRSRLGIDRGTWSRGRGWALWKALISLVSALDDDPASEATNRYVIQQVLADYDQ